MIIRPARPSDTEQIYDLFIGSQVNRDDLPENPSRGFYNYPLGHDDIAARADSPFSLVWINPSGRIIGYVLAYPLSYLPNLHQERHFDPVHAFLQSADPHVVYADQVYTDPGLPITAAARLVDVGETLVRDEGAPGVITAIPEMPWRNDPSWRFALVRGFSRVARVTLEDLTLGILAKPFLLLDTRFEGLGTKLVQIH